MSTCSPEDMAEKLLSDQHANRFHAVAWDMHTGVILNRHKNKSREIAIEALPSVLQAGRARDNTAEVCCAVFKITSKSWVSEIINPEDEKDQA